MALPKPWAQNKNQNQPYGGYGQNVGYGGSGIQSIYGGYGGAGGSYGASPYGDYGMSTLPGQMNAYVGLDANNVARDKNWYDYDIAWNRGNLDRLLGMTGLKNQYDLEPLQLAPAAPDFGVRPAGRDRQRGRWWRWRSVRDRGQCPGGSHGLVWSRP
jgi:hypothetical protein